MAAGAHAQLPSWLDSVAHDIWRDTRNLVRYLLPVVQFWIDVVATFDLISCILSVLNLTVEPCLLRLGQAAMWGAGAAAVSAA